MTYRDCISANTVSYLRQQYPRQTDPWMDALDARVDALCDRWRLTLNGHEASSRFGAILYGTSALYGDVAVKIVPCFTPRLLNEVACYRALPYREMCPLYDVDDSLGALLLRFVPQSAPPVAGDDDKAREGVFASLYDQRRLAEDGGASLPLYEDVLRDVTRHAARRIRGGGDANLSPLLESIARAEAGIAHFAGQTRCLIHGDAHRYNMLVDGGRCVLIDPLGYIAPFAFEFSRYLGTQTRDTPLSPQALDALVGRVLPHSALRPDALRAFAIDTTLRACNTFIEGNTYDEICLSVDWAQRAWQGADALLKG